MWFGMLPPWLQPGPGAAPDPAGAVNPTAMGMLNPMLVSRAPMVPPQQQAGGPMNSPAVAVSPPAQLPQQGDQQGGGTGGLAGLLSLLRFMPMGGMGGGFGGG